MTHRWSAPRRAFALLAALATFAACSDDPIGPRGPEDVDFDPSLGVNLDAMTKLPRGTYYQTLQTGAGQQIVGGEVEVAYTLWLWNGDQVDQSNSFTFEIDSGSVITGFNDGVRGMRVGETRLIVVPSDQGYGSRAQGSIPANAVLVFRVTLLTATGLDGPS